MYDTTFRVPPQSGILHRIETHIWLVLPGTLAEKWRSFGWDVAEVDGHSHAALREALTAPHPGKPRAVIAHTVKGKGIPFMENDVLWHYRFPYPGWEYDGAVAALHGSKPTGVTDRYTPEGRPAPDCMPKTDNTLSATHHPTWRTAP